MTYLRRDFSRNLQRMQEAIDLLGGPPISEERQRRAAQALGVERLLPDPEQDLPFPATPQAHSPPTVAASPDPQAPSVRRTA
jgi:hypothetical protein